MRLEVLWGKRRDVHEVPPCVNLFSVLREKYALLEEFPWNRGEFRADCGGNGRCGKCSVLWQRGLAEYQGQVVFGNGQSLPACRLRLLSDGTVRLPEQTEAVRTEGKRSEEELVGSRQEQDSCDCGIAVDIGTTNIKFAKVRLSDGAVLETYSRQNSQGSYGADVMARIAAACAGDAETLTALVRSDIKKGMDVLLPPPGQNLCGLSFACNTTMLSLLCGFPLDGMREHPFTPHCLEVPPKEWNNVTVRFAPCAGAFIGGDVVAGLAALPWLATQSCSTELPWFAKQPWSATQPWSGEAFLFLDLGTNGELVFGTDEKLLATSVAAGPAFESGDWAAGTSAIAALAEAYRSGAVDETGLLSEQYFETGYPFFAADGSRAGILTQSAVRDLQLAKAAVRTGIEYLLLKCAPVTPQHVYLAGGMGSLSERDCIDIGMLPEHFLGKTCFVGNAALAGAVRMLTDASACAAMKELAARIEEHVLAEWGAFGENYLNYINLPGKD